MYHLSMKVVKRSEKQSSVATAAYCSGSKFVDQRLTKTFNYQTKPGVVHSTIAAPACAPSWCYNREALWNKVEETEKLDNAQVARTIIIAFPRELDLGQQIVLLNRFVQESFVNKGMIADSSIHHDNPDNPHAHIMLTMRELTAAGFGKKVRDWNKRDFLKEVRQNWATAANTMLKEAGFDKAIDHRSNFTRGLNKKPTKHLGVKNSAALKRGVVLDRAKYNMEIEENNKLRTISPFTLSYTRDGSTKKKAAAQVEQANDDVINLEESFNSLFINKPPKSRG